MSGQAEKAIRQWLEHAVIGLNLCPFARREFEANRIRFAPTSATDLEAMVTHFADELALLDGDSRIETSLIIFELGAGDFFDYLDLLDLAQAWIEDQDLQGIYQLASFHPAYIFAGTDESDASNYTNRAPYPVIHILREESLEKAIASHPDTSLIPERNIALMREHDARYWQHFFAAFH